jgi:hypothetical protein
MERRELVERSRRAVVVDENLVEERRVGPPGPDRGEILLGDGHGLFHLLLCLEEGVVDHRDSLGDVPVVVAM